jgi:uncharacterized protein (TIGR03000 family)
MTRAVWGANYNYCCGVTPQSVPSHVPGKVAPTEEPPKPKAVDGKARLLIDVPANAKLFIDDRQIHVAAGERLFYTPTLTAGERYYYDVRIELVKDGKTVSESKKIVLGAGDMVRESFHRFSAPTAIASADKK